MINVIPQRMEEPERLIVVSKPSRNYPSKAPSTTWIRHDPSLLTQKYFWINGGI
jgi:hypothetical protein